VTEDILQELTKAADYCSLVYDLPVFFKSLDQDTELAIISEEMIIRHVIYGNCCRKSQADGDSKLYLLLKYLTKSCY